MQQTKKIRTGKVMFNQLNEKQKQWVMSVFNSLSEDEKIGQLDNDLASYIMERSDKPSEWLKKYPVGSIFTGSEIIHEYAAGLGETTTIQEVVKNANLTVPMLFSGDFENGIGGQIGKFTAMPRTMGLAASSSEQDYYDFGKVIGTEGRALDIRWGFGPVSDLNLNRENPVINIRSASDNVDHAVKVLKNIMKGMQDHGLASCPKHFPGDGTDTRNQHFVTSFNVLSKDEWDKQHGRVFKELIDAGAMSIMVGHLAFPAYEGPDERQLYRPATCSYKIMTELLRGELGFKGIIITDALCMNGYLSWGNYEKRIIDTFNGGADVFLWPEAERFFPVMKAALADGRISRERLDDSVIRILSFKALLGLMPEENVAPAVNLPELVAENQKIAQRIAENTITLLRNRDQVLPLKLEKGARILLFIGPDKQAPKSKLSLFAQELTNRGYRVTIASKTLDFSFMQTCVDAFDCVMFLSNANPQYSEYRGFDPIIWEYMACENKKKPIYISFGTPYFLYDVAQVATYINAYHDCPASIRATVKAMFGEIPFKGKSPVTVPWCFSFGDGLELK